MTKAELKQLMREVLREELSYIQKEIVTQQKKTIKESLVPIVTKILESRKTNSTQTPIIETSVRQTGKLSDIAHRKFAQSVKREKPKSVVSSFKDPMLNSIFSDTKPLTEADEDVFSFEDEDGIPMTLSPEGVPMVDTLDLNKFDFSRTLSIMEGAGKTVRG